MVNMISKYSTGQHLNMAAWPIPTKLFNRWETDKNTFFLATWSEQLEREWSHLSIMKLLTGNKITRANTIRIKAGFVNSAILSLWAAHQRSVSPPSDNNLPRSEKMPTKKLISHNKMSTLNLQLNELST